MNDVHQCSENMCSKRYSNKITFRNSMVEQRRYPVEGTGLVRWRPEMVQMAVRSEIRPLSGG